MKKMSNDVEDITFAEIKKIWETELWPNKKNGVKETNNWAWLYPSRVLWQDKRIEKNEFGVPYFFGIKNVYGKLVCVNSCFKTTSSHVFSYKDEQYWRSRGLWTSPDHRRMGLATKILNHTSTFVAKKRASWLWTVPRKSALSAYERAGFKKQEDSEFEDGQFGPNCIASKCL